MAGGTGWLLGDAAHYDREHCVDLEQLRCLIAATQPELVEALSLETEGPTRLKFLARLQGEISKRGTIDVLRHGIEHGARTVALFYGTPTPGNARAVERHANNRFSVTRQLRYSRDAQVGATVGHAEHSGDLRKFIAAGKKIIISTIQKFPFILDEIGSEHRGRGFAILIDEAHSSQGGKAAAAVSLALSEGGAEQEDETPEDRINRIMENRKLLTNASYFAFTATPKAKTLETFGEVVSGGAGDPKRRAFHSYTMKQAIQEGFILDVLASYTSVDSWYKLVKTVEDDPEFDTKKAGSGARGG